MKSHDNSRVTGERRKSYLSVCLINIIEKVEMASSVSEVNIFIYFNEIILLKFNKLVNECLIIVGSRDNIQSSMVVWVVESINKGKYSEKLKNMA